MIGAKIFPSIYKRNLREEKYVENIFERDPNGTPHSGIGRRGCDPLVLRKKLNCQSLLLEVVIHTRDADYWSAVPVRTERVLRLLTSTWQSHVSL